MRIDFSEPECSNCFHCRMLNNTQESEPSNVIVSSVNSMPVNSEPVQALGHDSTAVGSTLTLSPVQSLGHESVAVGSTSTSSPVQALGHDDSAATGSISTFSFRPQTSSAPPITTSLFSEPVQTLTPSMFRYDVFGSPFQTTCGSTASATSTSSTSSPMQSYSPNIFLFPPPITSVSSAPTQANTDGFNLFAAPPSVTSGSTQAPVAPTSGFGAPFTSTSSSFLPFGNIPPPPPWSRLAGQKRRRPRRLGHDLGQSQNASGSGGGSIFPSPTTPLSPFDVRSRNLEQGSRYPGYAPTPDDTVTGGMITSISASMHHQHKSHEELRWEDYKRGDKGFKINTVFGNPPIFASPSVPLHPQRPSFGTPTGPAFSFSQHNAALTGFGTHSSPISSSVQRPQETAAVSSPASACTACGATTSNSASAYSYFYGATTLAPPSTAPTYLPGLFFPTHPYGPAHPYGRSYGYGPAHPYGPTYGYGPMIFVTTPATQVTTPATQVTSPAFQA